MDPGKEAAPGDYSLVLESFDASDNNRSTKMTDRITITILESSKITPELENTVANFLAAEPINLSIKAGKVGFDLASYKSQYDGVMKILSGASEAIFKSLGLLKVTL